MASRQYNGQRSRAQSAASNATTQTAASTASTSIPMPTANNNNTATAAPITTAAVTSATTGASQSTAPAPIRRNLFHHHLSRRPPSSSASSATAPTTTGNNGSSIGSFNPGAKAVAVTAPAAENVDIVVRDKNGGYRIDVPMLPPGIVGDDGNGSGLEGIDGAEGDGKISEREKESKLSFPYLHTRCRLTICQKSKQVWWR
jgi:hypothetical protein